MLAKCWLRDTKDMQTPQILELKIKGLGNRAVIYAAGVFFAIV